MSELSVPEIFRRFRRVTVVGISANPARPSHWITAYLLEQGFEVVGVNPGLPRIPELPGLKIVASLRDVPEPLEIVNIYRSPDAIPGLVDELEQIAGVRGGRLPPVFWLQPGARNLEAEARARRLGMTVLSGNCIYQDHQSLN